MAKEIKNSHNKRNAIVGGLAALVLGSAIAGWEWNNLRSNPENEQTIEEYNSNKYHTIALVGGAAIALLGAMVTYAASTNGTRSNYK